MNSRPNPSRASASWSRPAPPASASPSPIRSSPMARRSRSAMSRTSILSDFRKAHPKAYAIKADVAAEDDVAALFDGAGKALGGLDALINNAGIAGPTGGVDEITPARLAPLHRRLPHRPVPLRPPRRADDPQGGRRRRSSTCRRPPAASAMRSARPIPRRSGASSASPRASPRSSGRTISASMRSSPASSRARA